VTAPSENAEGSGRGLGLLVAVGLLAGAALGVCLAWAWDRLRDRFRTLADLERHSGAPVLGRVPLLGDDLDIPWSGPQTRRAFSHVAVRLLTGLGNPRRGVMVLVASPRPAAGTTTVAFELASSLAGMGRTVVVVDARPGPGGLGDLLDRAGDPGLSDVLVGGAHVEQVVVPTPVQRLTLVPPGSVGSDGQMDVDALRWVVTRLAMRAIVVVDGPPLLEDAAAVVLADRADAVLLVADESKGTRSDARAAVLLLGEAAERLSGWVANRPAGPLWRRIVSRRPRGAGARPSAPDAAHDAGDTGDTGGPVPQDAGDRG
jgi:Mrp family chromosome partitioning ATPase